MNQYIIESTRFIEELESKYGMMRKLTGTIGKWFNPNLRLFFDCENTNISKCADKVYSTSNPDSLIVFFIVQSKDGYQLRDSRFKNIYDQNLSLMIERFHKVLEPSIKFGLQMGNLIYIECVGYGAVIKE